MPAIGQFLIAIVVIRVIFLLLSIVIYSNQSSSYLENFENPTSLVYFHMNGCGYCKKFNPVWDKFASSYKGNLKIEKFEREEAGEDMLKKYDVQGFPTILLLDGKGNKSVFDGERTVKGLASFANNGV